MWSAEPRKYPTPFYLRTAKLEPEPRLVTKESLRSSLLRTLFVLVSLIVGKLKIIWTEK